MLSSSVCCECYYTAVLQYDVIFETTAYTTRTRTLRYAFRSREIYTKESITSPEILSEAPPSHPPPPPPQTQDDSINSIQETPNSQFRLVLSVTPCMPHISSIESATYSPPPLLFSPTPTASPVHSPTHDSPRTSHPPPLSPTNSRTSSHNASPQHEESLPGSIELFTPTPSTIQNKWPCPPLPQRSPCIRRRHNLHNHVSLASTNGSYDVCSSVGAPPPDTPTSNININQSTQHEFDL